MSENEFLAKMTTLVHEYERLNDNQAIGVYVDLTKESHILEWDGEHFEPREDVTISFLPVMSERAERFESKRLRDRL